MGLKKNIMLSNGVQVSYHRIAAIHIYTNVQNTIEVQSYTMQDKRHEEIEAIPLGISHNVFKDGTYYSTLYDPNMTINKAYEYLKTLPEFENAEDIFEDN